MALSVEPSSLYAEMGCAVEVSRTTDGGDLPETLTCFTVDPVEARMAFVGQVVSLDGGDTTPRRSRSISRSRPPPTS